MSITKKFTTAQLEHWYQWSVKYLDGNCDCRLCKTADTFDNIL